MNTNNPVEDRTEIRLKMAYAYVVDYFPELPETSRLVLADCIVKALFKSADWSRFLKTGWLAHHVSLQYCIYIHAV